MVIGEATVTFDELIPVISGLLDEKCQFHTIIELKVSVL